MVFPSMRLYLDPPNWHQEPNQHQLQANGSSIDESAHQLLPPLPPQVQDPQVGSIRAGSMADRAQIAKIQPPEATLKCPRCESTSTKFCYFNNYNLAQPRHFCKTCRRYWTRGGALRNVPVGGGCRRNKKTKKGGSKSPALPSTEKHSPLLPNATSAVPSSASCQELIGRFSQPSTSSNRGFMASLQNISRYGTVGNMGQNELMGFQIGGMEQWRLQQFPSFFSGFESANNNNNNNNSVVSSSAGSYAFQGVEGVSSGGLVGLGDMMGASSRVTYHQMPPVKLEGNGGVNLIRSQVMSGSAASENNNQYYSWADLSGLAASSTAGHLQ